MSRESSGVIGASQIHSASGWDPKRRARGFTLDPSQPAIGCGSASVWLPKSLAKIHPLHEERNQRRSAIAEHLLVSFERFKPLEAHEHGHTNMRELEGTQHESNSLVVERRVGDAPIGITKSILGKEIDRSLAVPVIMYIRRDDTTKILGERFCHMALAASRLPCGRVQEVAGPDSEHRQNTFDQSAGGEWWGRKIVETVVRLSAGGQ
jgi:hypothetical protein